MKKKLMIMFVVMAMLLSMLPVLPVSAAKAVVSSVTVNGTGADKKGHLVVDGKPYYLSHVQNCGTQETLGDVNGAFAAPLGLAWQENQFEKTKALGFNTISIILKWADIEPTTQGVYDYSVVDKYIEWAIKYDLRIDFAWFGTLGCGGTRLDVGQNAWMKQVPTYVQDKNKYWNHIRAGAPSDMYFPQLTGTDATDLFTWERSAVAGLFAHLATADTTHRTILFQVNNEPNLHPGWSLGSKDKIVNYLDELAGVVKQSDYVVATRVNYYTGNTGFGTSFNTINYNNIDFVGTDPYQDSSANIATTIKNIKPYSKMPYIAENAAWYDHSSSMVTAAIVNGGYYDFWELDSHWCNIGMYNEDATNYKDWTVGTIPPMKKSGEIMSRYNVALNKIGPVIATAPASKTLGLNIGLDTDEKASPKSNYTTPQKPFGDSNTVFMKNTDADIGLMVYDSEYYYCISDTKSAVNFYSAGPMVDISVGGFNAAGVWVEDKKRDYSFDAATSYYSVACKEKEAVRYKIKWDAVAPTTDILATNITTVTQDIYKTSANLALSRVVYASGAGGTGIDNPGSIVDGKKNTSCQVNGQTARFDAVVDLEMVVPIKAVVATMVSDEAGIIHPGTDHYPNQITISISNDNVNWIQLGADYMTAGTTAPVVHFIPDSNISARYVRYSSINGTWWENLAELEVFGGSKVEATYGSTTTVDISNMINVAEYRHVGGIVQRHGEGIIGSNGLSDTTNFTDNNSDTVGQVNGWCDTYSVIVDLVETNLIETIQYNFANDKGTAARLSRNLIMYTSVDGTNWTQIGEAVVPTNEHLAVYFTPKTPVLARYVRFFSLAGGDWWAGMGEIRAFSGRKDVLGTTQQTTKPVAMENYENVAIGKKVKPAIYYHEVDKAYRPVMSWEGNVTDGVVKGNNVGSGEFGWIDTYWIGGGAFSVDLGETYTISGFGVGNYLNPEGIIGNKMDYVLRVSKDGKKWVQLGDYYTPTDNNDVLYLAPSSPMEGRYVQLLCKARSNWQRCTELEVYGAKVAPATTKTVNGKNAELPLIDYGHNVALGRPVQTDVRVNGIANLVDGVISDENTVQYNDYQGRKDWVLTVDLGGSKDVSAVDISFPYYNETDRHPEHITTKTNIRVSVDGINWTTVGGWIDTADKNLRSIRITPDTILPARYVQLNSLTGGDFYWQSLSELKVWTVDLTSADYVCRVLTANYATNNITANINATGDNAITVTLVASLSDSNGKLKNVVVKEGQTLNKGDNAVNLSLTDTVEANDSIKIMVLKGINDIEPLCLKKAVTIDKGI